MPRPGGAAGESYGDAVLLWHKQKGTSQEIPWLQQWSP